MKIIIILGILFSTLIQAEDKAWVSSSNKIAEEFSKDIGTLYPEDASNLGYTEFDKLAMNLTIDMEKKEEALYKKWVKVLKNKIEIEKDEEVKVDLRILREYVQNKILGIKISNQIQDIPFYGGSKWVFGQLQSLVNAQSSAERKSAAVDRFKAYVAAPILVSFEKNIKDKENTFKRNKKFYVLKNEIELYLSESADYVSGIHDLLLESGRSDWQEDFKKFEEQVKVYDLFIKEDQLKKARDDYKLPIPIYQFILKLRGMDTTPAFLIKTGRRDYNELYKEYKKIAEEIAIKHSLKEKDPVSVIKFLKSKQITSAEEAKKVYTEIDGILQKIITDNKIVTLPASPLKIRVAGDAESKAVPVPHLLPPPLVNNKGERPEFVVPSSSTGTLPFDDFSYREAAYILVVHEGRPGHDLQFSSMLDNGVSIIRSRYAFNNVNVEGWGLYAEDLMFNYLPLEAKLPALQMRLWRVARMFLDSEVQTGKSNQAEVDKIFVKELGVSQVMAGLEFRRYTFQDPGQAPAYYYGLLKLRQTKDKVIKKLGKNYSEICFNDAVLRLGLLPMNIIQEKLVGSLKCSL